MANGRLEQLGRFARERRHAIAYGTILLFAAALRYSGLSFLPRVPWGRPEEETFVRLGLELLEGGQANGSPQLWARVHHVVQLALRGWWGLTHDGAGGDLDCVYSLAPWRLVVPVRIVSATIGVLTVALTMRLGWIASAREATYHRHVIAWLCGLFYAVDVLAMREAHFAMADQALVLFLVWLLVATARGLERGSWIDFLSVGLALGLAIATDWSGLSFAAIPIAALLSRWRRFGPSPSNFGAVLLGVGGALAAFVLASRGFLAHPGPFLDDLALHYDGSRALSIFGSGPRQIGMLRHATVSLPHAFGWPLTLGAALGTLLAITRWGPGQGRITALIGLWTLFYWVLVGRTTTHVARDLLPLHPTACVAAALFLVVGSRALLSWWARRRPTAQANVLARRSAQLAVAAGMLFAVEPAFRAIETDVTLALPETRELAMTWLHRNAGDAPIDTVGDQASPYALEPDVASRCEAALPHDLEGWAPRLSTTDRARADVAVEGGTDATGEVVVPSPRPSPAGGRGRSTLTAEWAVVSRPWLPCQEAAESYAPFAPPDCYGEVARFEPEGIECDAVWDEQDPFYLPLWGFARPWWRSGPEATRWGPSITIYRSECGPAEE